MDIEVTLLGTGVGVPQPGRSQSSLIINGEEPLLFDCGAGTLLRLKEAGIDVMDLDTVVLTHLHLDHVSDLLALANARYLASEGELGLEIFGPEGTEQYVKSQRSSYPNLAGLKLSVHELYDGDRLSIKGFDIRAASTIHSVTALAYRIEQGSRVVAYSGDTQPSKKVADLSRGADLLVHECSFPEPYEVTNHSTPKNLGPILAGVKKIVLTHFYPEAAGHEEEMVRDLRASLKEDVPVEAGRDLQRIKVNADQMRSRAVAWTKDDPAGAEFAEVMLGRDMLSAVGVAIGSRPSHYRLDYRLETGARFVTSRFFVTARGQGWRRSLDLRRYESGAWSAVTEMEGDAPLTPPGGDAGLLDGAFHCDLGLSPLTNSMPVLDHGLLAGGSATDFLVAWVSVPDLGVSPSRQRYTPLKADQGLHLVRFEDCGGFVADLTFDDDGLVLDYPGLAHQIP